jgi:hypothetical protein
MGYLMAKNFYEWDSLELFNVWHNNLKLQLGYPIENTNQATGLGDGTFTESYTTPIQIDDKWIAVVEDTYADNLTLTNLRLPKPQF